MFFQILNEILFYRENRETIEFKKLHSHIWPNCYGWTRQEKKKWNSVEKNTS